MSTRFRVAGLVVWLVWVKDRSRMNACCQPDMLVRMNQGHLDSAPYATVDANLCLRQQVELKIGADSDGSGELFLRSGCPHKKYP